MDASSSGEGEQGDAPRLYVGEEVGTGEGPEVDIALDPLDGRTLCAKNLPNSLAAIAVTRRGGLLNAPDVYMEKIAIGPGFPPDLVDLQMPPAEAIKRLAEAKGVKPSDISACILDRPRHGMLIEAVRSTGASVRLIGDGDVAGIIHTTEPDTTGIDIYLGSGGAPEGVLAAAALRCIGGQMHGRLILDSEEKRQARRRAWPSRPPARLSRRRHGGRRCALRRDRHHRRQPLRRRPFRPRHGDDVLDRHAIGDRHAALGARQASERLDLRLGRWMA